MASLKPNPEALPVWSSWPGVTNTAARLGVRRNAIPQYVDDGELVEVIAADGSKRYDPATIDALEANLRAVVKNEATTETSADALKASNDLLRQAHDHIDKLINLLINGFEKSLEAVNRTNQRLSEENCKLAAVHWDAVAAREAAMSEASIRDLEQSKVDATNARRNKMLDTILPGVRPFIQAISGAISAWALGEAPAMRLLSTFSDDQLEALCGSEFLSDEQKDLLRDYLDKRKAARNGSQEGKQEGNQETSQEGKPQEGNQEDRQESKQQETGFAETES